MIPAFRSERGQAMVLSLLFLAVLLAASAAVIDVGAWYRLHRQVQATADAAALAGAQELPQGTGAARSVAVDYANRNGGGVLDEDITISGSVAANDTVAVTARRPAPLVFSKLFGLGDVTARASAKARAGAMGQAKWAAPIGVDYRHDMLRCKSTTECDPRFNESTVLDFEKVGPGAFRLINIDGSRGGTGPTQIGNWISKGLDAWMPRNEWYYSDPGIKPNSSHVKNALDSRVGVGKEILIPIYSDTKAQGASFEYYVIGWVGWIVTGYDIKGVKQAKVFGSFTRIIWEGIQSEDGSEEDFGARSVQLIE
jgi:putative Flp pilus-assembly TadE/G-like protein